MGSVVRPTSVLASGSFVINFRFSFPIPVGCMRHQETGFRVGKISCNKNKHHVFASMADPLPRPRDGLLSAAPCRPTPKESELPRQKKRYAAYKPDPLLRLWSALTLRPPVSQITPWSLLFQKWLSESYASPDDSHSDSDKLIKTETKMPQPDESPVYDQQHNEPVHRTLRRFRTCWSRVDSWLVPSAETILYDFSTLHSFLCTCE